MFIETQLEQWGHHWLRLEKRAHRQVRRLVKGLMLIPLNGLLILAFGTYWTLKLLMKLGWWWFESPKLRLQIKPGEFKEVSNVSNPFELHLR
jgi:hypothetical protein